MTSRKVGRPRVTSRETIAEAACELFLEQGFAQTSVVDIAQRSGVSRSSFFNYFSAKEDVFWAGFDETLDELARADNGARPPREILFELASTMPLDALVLGYTNALAMGITSELDRTAASRQARLGAILRTAATNSRPDSLAADVEATVYSSVFLVAVRQWASTGPGMTALEGVLEEAIAAVTHVS